MNQRPELQVGVIVGSLRTGSHTRKVARGLMSVSPPGLRCTLVDIADLPLYNEDLESDPPPAWRRFRQQIAAVDGVLFVSPEYNRSLPGCVKNAIDVGSRPPRSNAFDGKAAAIVGATPYQLGAMGAVMAIRQALIFLNMAAMGKPEAYIARVPERFAEDGSTTDEETRKFLQDFMGAFEKWIRKVTAPDGD